LDKKYLFFIAAAIILAVIFSAAVPAKKRKSAFSAVAKKPLTKNEQPMYFRLVESFPELIVLAQVSFSALMYSTGTASRNKFDRKTADFVLCTKSFDVVAVIELDDASHNGRAKEDGDRDALLTGIGYRVLRFKKTPDVAALQAAVSMLAAAV
jgi:hypothetical protein